MYILPVKNENITLTGSCNTNEPVFCHGKSNSNYTAKQKAVIIGTTALGVLGSLAILAKCAKYSLKPSNDLLFVESYNNLI